jgi:hypothetical protein
MTERFSSLSSDLQDAHRYEKEKGEHQESKDPEAKWRKSSAGKGVTSPESRLENALGTGRDADL